MRPCRCADPENCTEPIPGMVCRGSRGHASNGEPPEILAGDFVLLDGLGWRPVFTPNSEPEAYDRYRARAIEQSAALAAPPPERAYVCLSCMVQVAITEVWQEQEPGKSEPTYTHHTKDGHPVARIDRWQVAAPPPDAGLVALVAALQESYGQSGGAEQMEERLRHAWETGFRLAVAYGDNHAHWDGEQRERQWRYFLDAYPLPARPTETPT